MATTSITKRFVVKDDEACKKLIKALENPKSERVTTNYYDDGKKKLAQYMKII